jgi:Zn-dependent peptidase ImmA (M78 family)
MAHLWIGQSAISNPDPSAIDVPLGKIEFFCNQVAVELLVPRLEFTDGWNAARGKDKEVKIEYLAGTFWVSTLVVLRRANELQKVSQSEFFELREKFRKKQKPKSATAKARYYRNIAPRMSRRLTNAVLGDLHNGRILYRDAARLLGLRIPTLVKFAEIRR